MTDVRNFRLGDKVSLYHPDKKKNGIVKGAVIGGGYNARDGDMVYLVELDKKFQGYISTDWDSPDQYISAVIVSAGSVFSTSEGNS